MHHNSHEVVQAAFGAAVLGLRLRQQKTHQISIAPTPICNTDTCYGRNVYRKYQCAFIPLTSSISCLGLVRETPRKYQPCFSDMPSSEIASSVSIAPTGVKPQTLEEEAELSAPAPVSGRCGSANGPAVTSFDILSHGYFPCLHTPLVVSESRIFWWTSVSFCICDTYRALSHQVLPGL